MQIPWLIDGTLENLVRCDLRSRSLRHPPSLPPLDTSWRSPGLSPAHTRSISRPLPQIPRHNDCHTNFLCLLGDRGGVDMALVRRVQASVWPNGLDTADAISWVSLSRRLERSARVERLPRLCHIVGVRIPSVIDPSIRALIEWYVSRRMPCVGPTCRLARPGPPNPADVAPPSSPLPSALNVSFT